MSKSLYFTLFFVCSFLLFSSSFATYTSSDFQSPGDATWTKWLDIYDNWRCLYVNSTGGGIYAGDQLRVQRLPPVYDDNGAPSSALAYDTLAQGVAYGMIFSAYANDQTTFDGLWTYAQANFLYESGAENAPNCMQMHILANGVWVLNSAGKDDCSTDADQDMIFALLIADKRWGGSYFTAASDLASVVLNYEVDYTTNTIKYGSATYSGGSWQTVPSLFSTGYWTLFATVFNNPKWTAIRNSAYATIAHLNTRSGNTGLVTEFAKSDGSQPTTIGSPSANWYSWTALRFPWRMGTDLLWYNTATAGDQCELLVAHWEANAAATSTIGVGEEYLTGGYTDDTDTQTDMAFLSGALGCSLFSSSSVTENVWNLMSSHTMGDYYKDSIYTLSYLFALGGFQPPSTLTPNSPHTYGQCNLAKYTLSINGWCQATTKYFFYVEFTPTAVAKGTTNFQASVSSVNGPYTQMTWVPEWGTSQYPSKWWEANGTSTITFPVYIQAENQYWSCPMCSGGDNTDCTYLNIEPTKSATPSVGTKTPGPSSSRTPTKSRSTTVSPSRSPSKSHSSTRAAAAPSQSKAAATPSKTNQASSSNTRVASQSRTPSHSHAAASQSRSPSHSHAAASQSRTPSHSHVVASKSKTVTHSRVGVTKSRSVSHSRVVAISKSRSISRSRVVAISKSHSRIVVASKSRSASKSRARPSFSRSKSRAASRTKQASLSKTRTRAAPSKSRSRSV